MHPDRWRRQFHHARLRRQLDGRLAATGVFVQGRRRDLHHASARRSFRRLAVPDARIAIRRSALETTYNHGSARPARAHECGDGSLLSQFVDDRLALSVRTHRTATGRRSDARRIRYSHDRSPARVRRPADRRARGARRQGLRVLGRHVVDGSVDRNLGRSGSVRLRMPFAGTRRPWPHELAEAEGKPAALQRAAHCPDAHERRHAPHAARICAEERLEAAEDGLVVEI